jgi:hypothetical protein
MFPDHNERQFHVGSVVFSNCEKGPILAPKCQSGKMQPDVEISMVGQYGPITASNIHIHGGRGIYDHTHKIDTCLAEL